MEELFAELTEGLGGSPFKLASLQDGWPPRRGFSLNLWMSAQKEVYSSIFDPFVLALGQGSLPRHSFQAYVAEDNYFLSSFCRGYTAAIAGCCKVQPPSLATLVESKLQDLLAGAQEELTLHEGYAAGWGVDLRGQEHTPSPATQRYIDFLDNVISHSPPESGQCVASILSAMIPCLRLYACLGCTLSAFRECEPSSPYIEWLQTYSAPGYVLLPAIAEALLDIIVVELNTEEREKLKRQYHAAMRLEAEFFAAQPFSPPPRCINLLVIDFDDTCTAEDTTASVAHTAITAKAQKQTTPSAVADARQAGQEQMDWLVQNYLSRRAALLEEILPEVDEEVEEFDMGWLGDFLDRLSDFDREMNAVVVNSAILSGAKRGSLAEAGQKIEMRPGCLVLLRRAVDAGIPVAIVSVNWSAEMVQAALSQQGLPVVVAGGAGGTGAGVEGFLPPPGAVAVYANELEYFGDVSTGGLKRRCECASDKGRIFDDLLLGAAAEGTADPGGISIYIGDSMTDIPALISADVGVVLGTDVLLRQVTMAAGVPLRPLVAHPVDPDADYEPVENAAEVPVLYEAASWAEVDAFIFNRQFKQKAQQKKPSLSAQISGGSLGRALSCGGVGAPPRVLIIAGSDSGGGAGIQADIKACMANGAFAATAVTAVTAQNTHGVQAIHIPPPDFLRQQMRTVLSDLGADAVKTGMLPSVECVDAVAEELTALGSHPPLVLDPVLAATSGDALAAAGVASAVLERLFPLATVVTPNIHEASVFLGGRPIIDVESMKVAAQDLHAFGAQWVLLKGGHLKTMPDEAGVRIGGSTSPRGTLNTCSVAIDILYDGWTMTTLKAPYIETSNTHGTGCSFASVIATELAKGASVPDAVHRAKRYVWRALERSVGLPLGEGPNKPMNHGYKIADWRAELESAAAAAATESPSTELSETMQSSDQGGFFSGISRIPNSVDLRVYAVTDPEIIRKSGRTLTEAVLLAADGGATVVQLREKLCGGGEFADKAMVTLAACRSAGVPLIINDRVDVAMAVGADGVHVGQDDLPAAVVRRLVGPDMILGVSVKTVEQALVAEAAGADYLGAGAICQTGTKDSSVIGIEGLKEICEAVSIPVVAIGGIGADNAREVMGSGCAGVAAVAGIFAAGNPVDAARELRMAVDSAKEEV